MSGIQAGLINITANPSEGEIADFPSAHGDLSGLEVGGFNFANWVRGVQVGVVNYASSLSGLQVGLINIASKGALPFMLGLNPGFAGSRK